MPLSQNTSNVAAGIDYGSMLKQDNENARQRRVQGAMDFMQTGEVKDNRSWIQKSLSMNAPITSKKQAMSVLRRDQPDYHRQILANEEKQKEATEKLQVDQRKALKGAVPGLGTLLQQMRRLDDPEARVQLGNSGAQQIHQMIPPHLNMPQFETYTLESVTDEALDEDERELQLLGLEIQDSELSPSELNKVEENVGKMGDFQAAAKYYERRTGDQLSPAMFTNIQTITQEKAPTQLVTLSAREKEGLGFPKEAVVQKKANGQYIVVYKPAEDGQTITLEDGTLTITSGGAIVPTDTGAITKKEQESARSTINDAESALADGKNVIAGLTRIPGAAGLRGAIVENVGGGLAQIPFVGQAIERSVAQLVAGGSPEDVQKIRTAMITQVAAQLSAISGEESGRFTAAERQITERALASLEMTKSVTQAIAAQKTVMRLHITSATRARKNLGQPPLFKLGDKESVNAYGDALIDLGFTEAEIGSILADLMAREENPLLGGGNG